MRQLILDHTPLHLAATPACLPHFPHPAFLPRKLQLSTTSPRTSHTSHTLTPSPTQELFRQGDQEKAVGQPVSPLMDRTKTGITKSQCGFFNIVARPMYQVCVGGS